MAKKEPAAAITIPSQLSRKISDGWFTVGRSHALFHVHQAKGIQELVNRLALLKVSRLLPGSSFLFAGFLTPLDANRLSILLCCCG